MQWAANRSAGQGWYMQRFLKIVLDKPNGQVYAGSMNKKVLSEVMRFLGSRKSKAKAAASRKNGKLGGRPRKVKP